MASGGSWWPAIGGEDQALVEPDALLRRYDCGLLTADDFAWAEGLADWVPAEEAVQIHLRGQPPEPPPDAFFENSFLDLDVEAEEEASAAAAIVDEGHAASRRGEA